MTAICVQRFDDSLNSAIRMTYRISLRSSSVREPRYPGHRVVSMFMVIDVRCLVNTYNQLRKKLLKIKSSQLSNVHRMTV